MLRGAWDGYHKTLQRNSTMLLFFMVSCSALRTCGRIPGPVQRDTANGCRSSYVTYMLDLQHAPTNISQVLHRQAWQMRRKWQTQMREAASASRVRAGGVITKSKRLYPVTEMILSEVSGQALKGVKSCDRNLWRGEVQSVFEQKWGDPSTTEPSQHNGIRHAT